MGVKNHVGIHFLWWDLLCLFSLSPHSGLRGCALSPGVTHALSLQLAPEMMVKIRLLEPSKCCCVFFVLQGLVGGGPAFLGLSLSAVASLRDYFLT